MALASVLMVHKLQKVAAISICVPGRVPVAFCLFGNISKGNRRFVKLPALSKNCY